MSLLSGFKNPWESGGALDSGVLKGNALEGNVLTPLLEENSPPEVATRSDKFKLGNVIIIVSSRIFIEATGQIYKEKYIKNGIEKNNKIWDYITTSTQVGSNNVREWLNKYIQKIKDNQSNEEKLKGQLHNIIIISHGNKGALKLGNSKYGWLYGDDIDKYIKGDLKEDSLAYFAMKTFDILRDSIVDGGNILFHGCVSTANPRGAVSRSFPKYFTQKKKVVNMFFNRNETRNGGYIKNSSLYIPLIWEEGLTRKATPSWTFAQSAKRTEDIKSQIVDYDIAIRKQTSFEKPPYYDLIYPISPPTKTNWFGW